MRSWYLISYDIRDEKRLRRVARILAGHGVRLQYSVFRCRLSARSLERLRWELAKVILKEDDLLVVGLCERCVEKLKTHNPKSTWPEEERTFRIL